MTRPNTSDTSGPSAHEITTRLRNVLSTLDIECACHDRLDAAFERFVALEELREARQALESARHYRGVITAITDLLKEIDEIGLREPDPTVFEEAAMLFDDLSTAARHGAAAMRAVHKTDIERTS